MVTSLSNGGALFLFRHSSILFTSNGSVITAMTRISWPHFSQIRGSTSYTFWISRAQLCFEALDDSVFHLRIREMIRFFSDEALYPNFLKKSYEKVYKENHQAYTPWGDEKGGTGIYIIVLQGGSGGMGHPAGRTMKNFLENRPRPRPEVNRNKIGFPFNRSCLSEPGGSPYMTIPVNILTWQYALEGDVIFSLLSYITPTLTQPLPKIYRNFTKPENNCIF